MVVNNEQYVDWMESHLRAFGIHGTEYADRFLGAMISWQQQFTRRLYTYDELHTATQEIIGMAEVPRFAEGHLAAINSCIANIRERRRQRAVNDANANKGDRRCIMCNGNGVVIVPMLSRSTRATGKIQKRWLCERVNAAGVEVYLTAGVACTFLPTCNGVAGKGMTLDRYEKLFPDWHTEMKRIEDVKRATLRDQGVAHQGAFDALLESIIRRVKEGVAATNV